MDDAGGTVLRFLLVDDNSFRVGDGVAVEMDWRLWSSLSTDLLEEVLQWLPVASLCRFRAVSRAWKALLASPLLSHLSPVACPFEVRGPVRSYYGEPPPGEFRCKTHELDFAWMPPQFRRWYCGMDSVFSQSGLICSAYEDSEDKIHVCLMNPHTRTWKQLPPLHCLQSFRGNRSVFTPGRGPWEVILVADAIHFKVLVIFEGLTEAAFCVYSSCTGAWVITLHKVGLGVGFHRAHAKLHVVCNDVLYAVVGYEDRTMVMLSTEDGKEVGRVTKFPFMQVKELLHLAVHKECVLLVEREFRQRPNNKHHVQICRIWKLMAEWELIAVMPIEVLRQMGEVTKLRRTGRRFSYSLMDVKVAGDIVFLTLRDNGRQTLLVAYHMIHLSWKVILHDPNNARSFQFLDPRPTLFL